MKKSSSLGTIAGPAKKSAASRATAKPPSTARSGGALRHEPPSPTALAVLEPAPPPGIAPRRRVRFGYFNPEARAVHVVGSFNGWNPQATALTRDALGDWSVEIDLPPEEHRYRFFVDGDWRDDPSATQTAQNPFGGFDAIIVVV